MRALFKGLVLVALPASVLSGLWGVGVLGGNFREVVPGKLYRSAQLTGPNLAGALRDYRIASVINLRGARPGQWYYESERRICDQAGVRHLDVDLSSRHLPPPLALEAILGAFDRFPRPMLIHCEGGSDRSGLVATLYEAIEDGKPLDEAQARDLTWRYGHLAFTRAGQMDRFFDLYRRSCGTKGLRRWIDEDYPKIYRDLGPHV